MRDISLKLTERCFGMRMQREREKYLQIKRRLGEFLSKHSNSAKEKTKDKIRFSMTNNELDSSVEMFLLV